MNSSRKVKVFLFLLTLLSFVLYTLAQENETKHGEKEWVRNKEENESKNDGYVAVVTITILIIISILFEMLTELLKETTDEMNMPFVNTIFSELTTLGFIGLILFVTTKMEILTKISLLYMGEEHKLVETIELLHMGLFLFIIIFLVLCCGLLRLGTFVQNEWREFERGASDIPSIISDYILATEPPKNWKEKISIHRYFNAKKCQREMTYFALRRRFMDYRSNHANPEIAFKLAKEFQLNPDIIFPFNEYLSIISGEVMARLIEIDLPTWIALEFFLVAMLLVCGDVGSNAEIFVLMIGGFCLILMNALVYTRIKRMRHLLTPPRLLKDAERLRRKDEWRQQLHLEPLCQCSAHEKTSLLPSAFVDSSSSTSRDYQTTEEDFVPPYLNMLPQGGFHMTKEELLFAQKSILAGKGNGVLLALFSTRLVFLLTAMHLSTFLMRTSIQIYTQYHGNLPLILTFYFCFLCPSIVVTSMSVKIARDGLYAFNVEHMKDYRVITKVMRILKARQTLRTLRFVAEMKIYLRENVRKNSIRNISEVASALNVGKRASTTLNERRRSDISRRISSMNRKRMSILNKRQISDSKRPSNRTMQSPEMMMLEPSLSPLSAYFSPREKRSDTYKMEVERREINTIFCLFDIDGSGYVSKDEMESLLIAITHELDEAQLNRLMAELVSNNEQADEISFEDFYNWCHHHIHANNHSKEKLIEEIFKMIDTDNSGFITIDEFIAIFKTLGQSLDHDDVRELVYQIDRNQDGKIDLEEFSKMLHKHAV